MTIDAHGWSLPSSGSTSLQNGIKITAKKNLTLVKVTKHANCTATRAILFSNTYSVLATASFVGNDATFNYTLTNGVNYGLAADKSGSSYTQIYGSLPTYPFVGTNVNWITGVYNHADSSTNIINIVSIETTEILTAPNFKINVGDTWKTVSKVQINVGDAWKDVTTAQINVGDAWKNT